MGPAVELKAKPTQYVRAGGGPRRRVRVFMMDLLSMVPYYDGHLCAALAREDGLEVTLGAITYQYDRGYFLRQGIRNRPGLDIAARLPLPRTPLRLLKGIEGMINLAALALRLMFSRLDVLHVQFLPLLELGLPFERWVLRAARWLGVKVVHTVHNVLPAVAGQNGVLKRQAELYREIYGLADALICHDQPAQARLVREFGLRLERVRVIPHGPLFEDASSVTQAESRSRLGLEAAQLLVLWQGILRPYKGVSFLLDAWREVTATDNNVRLAIVGTGSKEMTQSIRDQVAALGIEAFVHLELRFVSVEELGYWCRAADVLVYPYSEATTSGALMTGLNYSKPVVATTLPAFQHMVRDGENALLVDYGDTHALAGAIRRLISDEGLRQALGERIREMRVTGPNWSTIARQTREYYQAVLAGAHGRPERAAAASGTAGL